MPRVVGETEAESALLVTQPTGQVPEDCTCSPLWSSANYSDQLEAICLSVAVEWDEHRYEACYLWEEAHLHGCLANLNGCTKWLQMFAICPNGLHKYSGVEQSRLCLQCKSVWCEKSLAVNGITSRMQTRDKLRL